MNYEVESIRSISSQDLMIRLHTLVAQERKLTLEIIECLEEIERRKLYAAKGYSGVFEMCVKGLGYSESQAHRRVSAMRVVREVPSAKVAVQEGKLSIATLSMAQGFFRQEAKLGDRAYTVQEKSELLHTLEGKSKRAVERELAEKATVPVELQAQPVVLKAVSGGRTRVELLLSAEQMQKLDRLSALMSHSIADRDWPGLIERISDLALEKLDPIRREARRENRAERRIAKKDLEASEERKSKSVDLQRQIDTVELPSLCTEGVQSSTFHSLYQERTLNLLDRATAEVVVEISGESSEDRSLVSRLGEKRVTQAGSSLSAIQVRPRAVVSLSPGKMNFSRKRYIDLKTRDLVLVRAGMRCQFVDSITGKRCEETRYLEVDHIQAFARNGSNDARNLRALCRAHNHYHAIRSFGRRHMSKWA